MYLEMESFWALFYWNNILFNLDCWPSVNTPTRSVRHSMNKIIHALTYIIFTLAYLYVMCGMSCADDINYYENFIFDSVSNNSIILTFYSHYWYIISCWDVCDLGTALYVAFNMLAINTTHIIETLRWLCLPIEAIVFNNQ